MARKPLNRSERFLDLFYLLLILLSALFFYRDAIFYQTRTLRWDGKDYFYPIFHFVSSLYRQWELPLWNPYLFNGFPSIGNIESQAFYPPNILFIPFSVFTPYVVYLQVVFHYLLSGVSMYVATRCYSLRRESCLLSAFTYMYSGFMIGHFSHITMIDVFAWFPLIFCVYDKALLERNFRLASLAGFILGVSILAGHPQSSHIIFSILTFDTIFRTFKLYSKDKNVHVLLKSAAILAITFGVGVCFSAVQWVPTIDLVKEAVRGSGLSFDVSARSGQLSWQDLVLFFMPNYYGAVTYPYWGDLDVTQNIVYIGIIPLLSVGLSVLYKRKESNVIYFGFMAIAFFILSLGEHGLLYLLFFKVFPGVNLFRSPVHWIICSIFFLSFLAGYGFDALMENRMDKKIYLYLFMVFISIVILFSFSPNPTTMVLEAQKNIKYGFIYFLIMFSLFVSIVSLQMYIQKSGNICAMILLLLAFIDFYISMANASTLGLRENPEILQKNPIVDYIQKKENYNFNGSSSIGSNEEVRNNLFRVIGQPTGLKGLAPLWFNAPMVKKMHLVEGFEPLLLKRHEKLIDVLAKSNFERLLKICNVKYIVSSNPQRLFEYKDYLPRFYMVGKAKYFESDDKLLEKLSSPAFDPMQEVLISGKDALNPNLELPMEMNREDWGIHVSRYSPNQIEVNTSSKKDGWLVLSDTYYKGWTGFIDGETSTIRRANFNFRALYLPKGNHSVSFIFKSDSFYYGLTITLFTVIILIFIFLVKPKIW